MIERKNIVIPLLDFSLKCQPVIKITFKKRKIISFSFFEDNILRQETINTIKFITDVNSTDDINLVFDNMTTVRVSKTSIKILIT